MSAPRESSDLPFSSAVEDEDDGIDSHPTTLHGSCAHCNHYNKHIPFGIPRDPSKHVRVLCERCGYPIIGFGRSSTQTTLASADSIPLSTLGRPSPQHITICTNVPNLPSRDISSHARGPSHLTPLLERSPLSWASPINQSPQEGEEDGKAKGGTQGAEEAASRNAADGVSMDALKATGISARSHSHRHRSVHSKFQKLRRITKKFREGFSLGFLRRHVSGQDFAGQPGSRVQADAHESSTKVPEGKPLENEETSDIMASPLAAEEADRGSIPQSSLPVQDHPRYDDTTATPLNLEEENAGTTRDLTFKEERLRRIRREKTLRQRALYEHKCSCEDNCRCKIAINDEQGNGSGSRSEHRTSIQAVPDYMLDRGADSSSGSYASIRPRSLITRLSGQQFNRSPRTSDEHFSQAPTHVGSDESVETLSSRRESSPRRSSPRRYSSSDSPSSAPPTGRAAATRGAYEPRRLSAHYLGNTDTVRAISPLHLANTMSDSPSQSRPSSANTEPSPRMPQSNVARVANGIRPGGD